MDPRIRSNDHWDIAGRNRCVPVHLGSARSEIQASLGRILTVRTIKQGNHMIEWRRHCNKISVEKYCQHHSNDKLGLSMGAPVGYLDPYPQVFFWKKIIPGPVKILSHGSPGPTGNLPAGHRSTGNLGTCRYPVVIGLENLVCSDKQQLVAVLLL